MLSPANPVCSKRLSIALIKKSLRAYNTVCLFVGLIAGMLPSLFREAGSRGRSKSSFVSLAICFCVTLALLIALRLVHSDIRPNFA